MSGNILIKLRSGAVTLLKAVVSERHRFETAVLLSILCHIAVLIFAQKVEIDASLSKVYIPAKEEEQRLEFEIVETQPENAVEIPPENTKFLSDKNTQARDNNPETTPKADQPVTEGIAETKELPVPEDNMKNIMQMRDFYPLEKFSLEKILQDTTVAKQRDEIEQKQQKDNLLTTVMPKNQKTSPEDIGGLSLSTYAWDFAPYMLELKRKINENIHPPIAFTEFGLIDGRYVIQFVITRAGELKNIKVLSSEGSKALENTSWNAVKYSAPFKPLPYDFPDQELIVTGNFYYYVR